MTSSTPRHEAVLDLVALRRPLPEVREILSTLERPGGHDLVTLRPRDVVRALDLFSSGALDDEGLTTWAEAVHGREDVALEPAHRDVLADALFELSTPELFGDMTGIVAGLRVRLA